MQDNRIPVARSVRWRKIRAQAVPAFAFSLAVVASGWLWLQQGALVQGIGEVDSPRVDVASPTAGLVVSLPNQNRGQWLVYDHVRAGDVIAHIEDQQLEIEKTLLRQAIKQLMDQFLAAKPGDDAEEKARTAWEGEQRELASLDAKASAGPSYASAGDAPSVSISVEAPLAESSAGSGATARLRAARLALDQRWEELRLRARLLEIQSPISGTLVAVHCWPGQSVPPGGLIATIAADHGQHVVGYIPEQSSFVPKAGMPVALRTRIIGSQPIVSVVEQVGRQIEQVPRHQRAVSTMPQWGIPVRIKMPTDAPLRPGALVDLSFDSTDAG